MASTFWVITCSTARVRRVGRRCNCRPTATSPPAREQSSRRSGDGNQGGEMTVSVTELEGLDPARAGGHGVVERVGSAGGESGLAVLLPHAVQRLESRC